MLKSNLGFPYSKILLNEAFCINYGWVMVERSIES